MGNWAIGVAGSAGAFVDFDTYGFLISGEFGTGMPTLSLVGQEYATLDGSQFQRTRAESRTIVLKGVMVSTSSLDYATKMSAMEQVLWRDRSDPQGYVTLRYTGGTTTPIYIDCYYQGGLEGERVSEMWEKISLRFWADTPSWYSANASHSVTAGAVGVWNAILMRASDSSAWTVPGGGSPQNVVSIAYDSTGANMYFAAGASVYQWNGSVLSILGTVTGGSEAIYAVAVAANGHVYIGGSFTAVNFISANNIARRSTVWNALGTGTNGAVHALANTATYMYIGGAFFLANGAYAPYVANYHTTSLAWGYGMAGVNLTVLAMYVHASSVYIGGSFTSAGLESAAYIARWNEIPWSALGTGLNGNVSAVAIAPDGSIYVVGAFTTAGGVGANYIAKWDGSAWSALGTGLDSPCYAIAVAPDGTVYVGGAFTTAGGVGANYIAKWNGTAWSALGTGLSSYCYAIAVAPDGTVYAGGDFTTAGGVGANNIAKWDGSTWSALGTGLNNPCYALAAEPSGRVYVGGVFTTAGGIGANRIAIWDVTFWSALGTGLNNRCNAIAIAPDGSIYAGGDFTTAGGVGANYIARWYGSAWSALGTGLTYKCYAMAIASDGTVYVGGVTLSFTGYTTKWDGVRWSALGTGLMDGICWAMAITSNGTIYAAGQFTTAGGVGANRIAKCQEWGSLNPGLNAQCAAITTTTDGVVIAGGGFTTAGGIAANNLAKWDGLAWSAVSEESGSAGYVRAIASPTASTIITGCPAGNALVSYDLTTGKRLPQSDVWLSSINAITIYGTKTAIGSDLGGGRFVSAVTSITNTGSATVAPVITVACGATSGVLFSILNTTTGANLYFTSGNNVQGYTMASGETLTIDCAARTITSSIYGARLSAIKTGSSFARFSLLPGANTITSFHTSTSATVTVAYTKRHVSARG